MVKRIYLKKKMEKEYLIIKTEKRNIKEDGKIILKKERVNFIKIMKIILQNIMGVMSKIKEMGMEQLTIQVEEYLIMEVF